MTSYKPVALIIDDEPDLLSLPAISLRRMGVESVKAPDIKSIVKLVQSKYSATPVAVITAFGDPRTAVKALKPGAFDYVSKPVEIDQLERMVKIALRVKSEQPPQTAKAASQVLLDESGPIKNLSLK